MYTRFFRTAKNICIGGDAFRLPERTVALGHLEPILLVAEELAFRKIAFSILIFRQEGMGADADDDMVEVTAVAVEELQRLHPFPSPPPGQLSLPKGSPRRPPHRYL